MNTERRLAFSRDKGICARCNADCEKIKRVYWRILDSDAQWFYSDLVGFNDKVFWEADHVIERADGGSGAPENIQTLCRPCHRIKTTEARRAREEKRIAALSLTVQQTEVQVLPPENYDWESIQRNVEEMNERVQYVVDFVNSYIAHRIEVNGGYWPRTLQPIESDYLADPMIHH